MLTLSVVKHLDVIEHILPAFVARQINPAPDPLTFQQLEEALHHRVVMAVAAPTHAGDQVVRPQECLPVMAAELAALIRMNRYRLRGPSAPHSLFVRAEN